jgi:glycosyltransferase involved in cell wall biosynthesis
MNKIKVAMIGLKGLPAVGGGAAVGENIISNLYTKCEFSVFSVRSHVIDENESKFYKQIIFNKFPFIKSFNLFMYYFKSAIYVLFKGDYDIIHVHHIAGSFILPILKLKYKVILTSHGIGEKSDKYPLIKDIYYKIMNLFAEKYADKITTVSKVHKFYYEKIMNRNLVYIPNGVSVTYKNKNLSESNYVLFCAARIIGIKGCDLLLKALKKIKYSGKLMIIGDLNQRKIYKNKILKLARGLNVDFKHLISDKDELYSYISNAKLFVFPSRTECMSMMLLEVASIGTPIISSDIPENKSIFLNDEAIYFKSNDYNDLAIKLKFSLSNYSLLKENSKRALKKVQRFHKWDKISRDYLNQYKEIIYDKI